MFTQNNVWRQFRVRNHQITKSIPRTAVNCALMALPTKFVWGRVCNPSWPSKSRRAEYLFWDVDPTAVLTLARQLGQVTECTSHFLMHWLWKMCPQDNRRLGWQLKVSQRSVMQIEQLPSVWDSCCILVNLFKLPCLPRFRLKFFSVEPVIPPLEASTHSISFGISKCLVESSKRV